MTAQNILITGGAGFIGSRLIKALIKVNPNRKIWVYDNLHPQVHGVNAVKPAFPEQVTFVYGDVVDSSALQQVVSESSPEIVYHLAAETGTGQSYDEPTRYCNVNVIGTTNLVEALRKVKTPRKVILAASRAVYGEGAYLDAMGKEYVGLPRSAEQMQTGDFSVPLTEGAVLPARASNSHAELPPAPASVYASTKLMQEYLLTQAGEGASWGATILRFQNVYGPGQSLNNPYTGVLSIFAKLLLSGESLSIFEDGEISRDFVYVDDVVDALVLAADKNVPHGTIVDIGSGEAVTILDVAKILMRALGVPENSYTITGQFRVGDIRYACADNTKAKLLLNWEPKVSITKGLGDLAAWAIDSSKS